MTVFAKYFLKLTAFAFLTVFLVGGGGESVMRIKMACLSVRTSA